MKTSGKNSFEIRAGYLINVLHDFIICFAAGYFVPSVIAGRNIGQGNFLFLT